MWIAITSLTVILIASIYNLVQQCHCLNSQQQSLKEQNKKLMLIISAQNKMERDKQLLNKKIESMGYQLEALEVGKADEGVYQEAMKLLGEGLDKMEVSKRLNISQAELSLIENLEQYKSTIIA